MSDTTTNGYGYDPSKGETPMRQIDEMTTEQWLAIRREAALHIDPETAEVFCEKGMVLDPYRAFPADDRDCYGAVNCFVRSPGSDVWVWDGDLPEDVCKALWEHVEPGTS
jgi:hypothetical protein